MPDLPLSMNRVEAQTPLDLSNSPAGSKPTDWAMPLTMETGLVHQRLNINILR